MGRLFLRVIVRIVLPVIHKLFTMALGVKPLARSGSVICVEPRRHKGSVVRLMDGCEVRPGDHVIKLHFDNAWFNEKRQSGLTPRSSVPFGLFHYFKDDFRLLAAQMTDGKYSDVIALYGWTVLHAPAKRLGFQVIDLPNTLRTKLAQFYIIGLMHAYHILWCREYNVSQRPLQVKAVWLSRAELLRLYGPHS